MLRLKEYIPGDRVALVAADEGNVDLLVGWTLDPVAQGPHKVVPDLTAAELRERFLHSADCWYYVVREIGSGRLLGRFYYRAWRFDGEPTCVDYELNLLIADPADRGRGYGTAVGRLALDYLLAREETHSVFAVTRAENTAARRMLEKVGMGLVGGMPDAYYRVEVGDGGWVVYAVAKEN